MKLNLDGLKDTITKTANGNEQIEMGITREVLQRTMLCSLSETDFFDNAAFCGGTSHALLSREYVKGRDWYDFEWYVKKGIELNYKALEAALKQTNPKKYPESGFVNREWYANALSEKIKTIDWDVAKKDVFMFAITPKGKEGIKRWSTGHFQGKVSEFAQNCTQKDKERRQSRDSGWER